LTTCIATFDKALVTVLTCPAQTRYKIFNSQASLVHVPRLALSSSDVL
jgi:hypothetical protein